MIPSTAIEQAFRQESSQVLATLIGHLGDFQLAEDALQDALVAALEHWGAGVPQRPGAWLMQVASAKPWIACAVAMASVPEPRWMRCRKQQRQLMPNWMRSKTFPINVCS